MTLPLFSRFAGLADLPLAGIATLPTPLEVLAATDDLPEIMVKRDDMTAARYGGNKVRKLDFLLGDALARGYKTVMTFGAYGSNHALATALYSRELGLEPHVILSPQEPGPYAPKTLLAHAALGTVIHLVDDWDGRRDAVRAKQAIVERDGMEPYIIPMGGTCPIGAVGYVNAALEVADSAADVVYVAAGTLGTAVGLALGFAAAGTSTTVEAVRVTPFEICNEQIAEKLVDDTVAFLRAHDPAFPVLTLSDLRFNLRHEFFEPGYGVVTPQTLEALELASESGTPGLETTYTGKAFSALVSDVRGGSLDGKKVLFWDTYNSAPYPPAGELDELPQVLQNYIADCRSRFTESS